jgi:hypothetical protein
VDHDTEVALAAVTGLLADAGLPSPTRHHSLEGFRCYQTGAAVPGAPAPPDPVRRTGRAQRAGPLVGVGVPARIRVRVWADDGTRVQIAVADRFDLQIYEVTFTPVTAVALPALAATLTALLAERRTS